jgi:hypothetical protein
VILSTVILAGLLASFSPAQNYCHDCHGPEVALELDRPHLRAGIGCVDCHGGDSTAQSSESAKAGETGYRVLERGLWPNLCGDCHADVRRMNLFGIPTDQLAQYRTSRHGEAFFEDGDQTVATCVDCHGSHGILSARSPESPVYPANVPTTCSKCHSDAAIVDEYGFDGDEEESYRESVHAVLLLQDGDLSAPQCATCHGNHGAVPPGFAEVGAVCGNCHVRQKELFDLSPHARLVEDGEFGACVSCHSHHRVLPAGEHILERMCTLCHGAGDRGLETRDQLLTELRGAGERFQLAEKQLAQGLNLGFATETDQVLLENARTSLVELQALQHSLDPGLLERSAREARSTLERLSERISSAELLETLKRVSLLPVVLFLGLMSLGFWMRFRRIHQSEREAS